MAAYELSKEWIAKNYIRLKEAYNTATVHNLDITSSEDMLRLLNIIDPINATDNNAIILSKLLPLFSYSLKREIMNKYKQKRKIQKKIIN